MADRVSLAAAIAEFAEIAVDRHLRLLAVLGARDDVEGRFLAGDLLQNALPDVENDRRTRSARRMRMKAPERPPSTSALASDGDAEKRRIGRGENIDPVARLVRGTGLLPAPVGADRPAA